MKFSVPTNIQNNLISQLNKEKIHCLYGKLNADFVGGGRPSLILPSVNKKLFKKHVEEAHRNGLKFNYILNAACLGNKEYTISGQRRINKLLDWLLEIKVDSVTIAIPYLAQLIKKRYPQLKLYISALAHVNSIIKAKYWQDLGVDLIVLESFSLNRNFEILNKIRQQIKCELELVANNACLYDCPLADYHQKISSHASQEDGNAQGYFINYCIINCRNMRLKDTINFIRSEWIRPEDIRYYEEIGINYLKIVDRSKNIDFILRVVNAYTNRKYEGNLADLFPFFSEDSCLQGISRYLHNMRYIFQPFKINIFKIRKIFESPSLKVYIDNRALDNFLDFFIKGNCKQGLCDECGYCAKIAKKTVKIDEKYLSDILLKYKDVLNDIISGRPFRYF